MPFRRRCRTESPPARCPKTPGTSPAPESTSTGDPSAHRRPSLPPSSGRARPGERCPFPRCGGPAPAPIPAVGVLPGREPSRPPRTPSPPRPAFSPPGSPLLDFWPPLSGRISPPPGGGRNIPWNPRLSPRCGTPFPPGSTRRRPLPAIRASHLPSHAPPAPPSASGAWP